MPLEYICDQCPEHENLRSIILKECYPRQPNDVHFVIRELVKKGVFKHIITTNWDTCLEDILPNYQPLLHIIEKQNIKNINIKSRILFKIHGSASKPETLIYRLSQEGVLPDWKRKVLHFCLKEAVVLIIGYSGSDFEICPEILLAKPKKVIWISLYDPLKYPDTLSGNARRVIENTNSVVYLGDLKKFMDLIGFKINLLDKSNSNIYKSLINIISINNLNHWACGVLAPAGYARQTEIIAHEILSNTVPNSYEYALSKFWLAEALFTKGKYKAVAKITNEASRIFLKLGLLKNYFSSESRGIDALRCSGKLYYARKRLFNARKQIITSIENDDYLKARFELNEILIIYEYFRIFRSLKLTRKIKKLRLIAEQKLRNISIVFAKLGSWYDLQQCKMWGNRMDIRFEDIYNGPLKPLDDWFGYRSLGHIVAEMMAARDSFWEGNNLKISLEKIKSYLKIAKDIGCMPEVWKLSLLINKYYKEEEKVSIFDWLVPFFECQYTLWMRFFKLWREDCR